MLVIDVDKSEFAEEKMEDVLELILTIITAPFGDKYDDLYEKIKQINNKYLRFILKILIILVPVIIIFAVCALASYLIRGYWF